MIKNLFFSLFRASVFLSVWKESEIEKQGGSYRLNTGMKGASEKIRVTLFYMDNIPVST